MEQFCARTLDAAKMLFILEHLDDCEDCCHFLQHTFRRQNNYAPIVIDLSPESWLRHEHLDYEWLIAYVDETMDSDEREMTENHLQLCRSCNEEVKEFIAWRRESEPELKVRYLPDDVIKSRRKDSSWLRWFRLPFKPRFAFGSLLALGAVIVLMHIFLRPNSGPPLKQQAAISPSVSVSLTPNNHQAALPPPIPTPRVANNKPPYAAGTKLEREPAAKLTHRRLDRKNIVAVNGLEEVPAELQRTVAEFLSAEKIERPIVLDDLAGDKSGLRGEGSSSIIKLLSPAGVVIAEGRPTFRWERAETAESYRIYVSDARGNKVADSGSLPPSESQWSPPLSLKRGEVYSWAVGAIVNGEEIISPSPSAPEVKFRVLSTAMAQSLDRVKQTTNSPLARGIVYAQAGMIAEAEREFQTLVNKNPDAPLPARLLRLVQSWR